MVGGGRWTRGGPPGAGGQCGGVGGAVGGQRFGGRRPPTLPGWQETAGDGTSGPPPTPPGPTTSPQTPPKSPQIPPEPGGCRGQRGERGGPGRGPSEGRTRRSGGGVPGASPPSHARFGVPAAGRGQRGSGDGRTEGHGEGGGGMGTPLTPADPCVPLQVSPSPPTLSDRRHRSPPGSPPPLTPPGEGRVGKGAGPPARGNSRAANQGAGSVPTFPLTNPRYNRGGAGPGRGRSRRPPGGP